MIPKQSSMKVADEFKTFVKRAIINHAYVNEAEDQISQVNMQLRIVKYFKLNVVNYEEFINMENTKC